MAFDTRRKGARNCDDFYLADASKSTFETLILNFLDQTVGH
jgi:hypothetical protein